MKVSLIDLRKRKKNLKKDETHRAPTAEEIKNIKTLVKGYVTYFNSSKAKSDPVVIKATNDFKNQYNEIKKEEGKEYADEEFNNGKIPKLIFSIFEERSDYLYIEICDDTQECRSWYACDIINEMIRKLKQDIPNYSEFIKEISSGDGDEGVLGVLYINFYK